MRYLKSLTILLFICSVATTGKSQVTLTISPLGPLYEREIIINGENRSEDTIQVTLPTNWSGNINFIIKGTPHSLEDNILFPDDPIPNMMKINTGYRFYIEAKKEIETRSITQILKYSIIPGGGRFYAKKPWQGIGIAILQIAPIPFVIYCNEERKRYYSLAEKAAVRGDREELDKNFKKSQDFRQCAGFATGVVITATLVNIFDVLINVKDTRCEPLVSNDGFRLKIIRNW